MFLKDGCSRTWEAEQYDCSGGGVSVSIAGFAWAIYPELGVRFVFIRRISCFASIKGILHRVKSNRIWFEQV